MAWYLLVLGTLSVWRVTYLLHAEDGPVEMLVRLRRLAGASFIGNLMDCFYCLSLWIAVPFAWWLGVDWRERFLLWLSFSAGAILLERLTHRTAPPAPYIEDKEPEHGMLRSKTETSPGTDADQTGG